MSRRLISPASILAIVIFWELAGATGFTDVRFFPRPTMIATRFLELTMEGTIFRELGVSLRRVALGALAAIPPALVLALLSELNKSVRAAVSPWMSFLYPAPKLALFPFLLLLFGVGEGSKIALIAIGVFFLVYFSSAQGLRRILASEFYEVALVYRIPLARRIFRVLLPGAIPEILNGLKLGMGYSLVMVVAAEFSASQNGIGVFVWSSWDRFRIVDLYCGVTLICTVGFLIFAAADFLERRLAFFE